MGQGVLEPLLVPVGAKGEAQERQQPLDSEGAKSTCDPIALTKVVFWPSLWI